MSLLEWFEDDLDVTRTEIAKAFLVAPFLLAGVAAFCLLLIVWMPE